MSSHYRRLIHTLLLATSFSAVAQPTPFEPLTDTRLVASDPADWPRWRGNHTAAGYSALDQINRDNVKNLRLAWTASMQPGLQESEPAIYNGIMYLPQTKGVLQALDAATGEPLWEYRRKMPEGTGNDTTRNIAIYQDKIFLTTEDAYLVALDAATGKLLWEILTGVPEDRVNYSSGPIAANGKVFAGQTCGTGTSRGCFITAHDAATGKELWRRGSIAGPNDPAEHNATWDGVPYEQRKKASFWLAGSYDPELNLLYWTTASPYPYPEILKGTKGGDLLYTNSILALDADTGAIRWHFQMQPRDNFDMDHQDNPILADVEINGKPRKLVYVLGKPGILWAFDRVTGEFVWHRQLVSYQNLFEKIDPATGAITMNTRIIPKQVGESATVCPGMRGGKLFQSKAYSPKRHIIFSPVSNECTTFKVLPLDVSNSGVDYSKISHMEGSGEQVGRLTAVDGATGELLWKYDQRAALGSVLVTGGDIVFVGDLHRKLLALDAENGQILWEQRVHAPISGYPSSYAVNGRQYLAFTVGGGTAGTMHLAMLYPELKVSHGNNMVMVFTLPE